MNKVIEKDAPTRLVAGPDNRFVKIDARRNVTVFHRDNEGNIHPIPFNCEQCSEGAVYGFEGQWFCSEHWKEHNGSN